MKVFAAAIWGETHQFNQVLATNETIQVCRGKAIKDTLLDSATMWGAIFTAAEKFSWNLIYPLEAFCGANTGPVEKSAFDALANELLASLKQALPVDGVILPLHGSLLAEHIADTEGYLIESIRALVGDEVPITVGLDSHGNVTQKMCNNANILTAFRTNPHVDQYETGERAANLLQRVMTGEIKPRTVLARLPMLDALDRARTQDPNSPICHLLKKADDIEAEDNGLLLVSIHAGYAWADFPEAGPSVAVVHNDEEKYARQVAAQLIGEAWRTKDYRSVNLLNLDEAIARAKALTPDSKPLVISDYTDSPGGGGYGDCTNLLKAMFDAKLTNAVCFAIADPVAAQVCHQAGVGNTVVVELGGKMDAQFSGAVLKLTGTVSALSDGRYIHKGKFAHGIEGVMGPSARLTVKGVEVIITTHPAMADDQEQLRSLGVNPEEKSVIALKGISHFRADYEPISSEIIAVDAKGICTLDYRVFNYRHLPRPIWPLDDMPF